MSLPETFPSDDTFEPSYAGGRLEREWLLEALTGFYDDRLITDILYKVKGGKEANVYCCAAHPDMRCELLAAKVYRPEAFRAMKNDGLYRLGREEVDGEGKRIKGRREQRAMARRTRLGRALRSGSWIHYEYQTLCALFDAGVDVPQPVTINDRAILMEYIGDRSRAAPTLHEVGLEPAEAQRAFDDIMRYVAIMLDAGKIHGDLSAYNVLYHNSRAVIIDLPQCVDPYVHPQAFALLSRDVERVCDYFKRCGLACDPHRLVSRLWAGSVFR